jgi:hypothetical protein
LRVFEKRMLRTTFGSKREEVTGSWRKLANDEYMNCTLCRALFFVCLDGLGSLAGSHSELFTKL